MTILTSLAFLFLLCLLALQRGVELVFAASNTAHLRRHGGQEIGRAHYPLMVGLHLAWFLALLWERFSCPTSWSWTALSLGWAFLIWGQGLRWWTIRTLGRRWTTRIMVLPGAPLVLEGPFRLVRHPNYLGVWLEIVGVPLIGGCWRTALVLGTLHSLFLVYRIRIEDAALRDHGCLPAGEAPL